MAIAAHQDEAVPFKIEAFTCSHGNTTVQNVAKNVTRTLQTVNENTVRLNVQFNGFIAHS
jgi:inosine-uridine nucleoside N-ribohydrolase